MQQVVAELLILAREKVLVPLRGRGGRRRRAARGRDPLRWLRAPHLRRRALVLANTSSYAECALAAVNLGDDTDTTAAVAGALAGIVYGIEGIPAEWLDKLRGKGVIEACLF